MISKKQIENCLKGDIIGQAMQSIEYELKIRNCLPPEEGKSEFDKPRRAMLSDIRIRLEDLYDDAQAIAKIDLTDFK